MTLNGSTGIYDNMITDKSVKYGRNAIQNNFDYLEAPVKNALFNPNPAPILDFGVSEEANENNIKNLEEFIKNNDEYLNSLPALEYEYRYMPQFEAGKVDKKALLGAAYEEMGGVKELPVEEFEYRYMNDDMTAEPLDINKDDKIDLAEYSANILATDVLSKGTTDVTKVDGTINTKGMNAILECSKKMNALAATKLYTNLYNTYGLASALSEFKPE